MIIKLESDDGQNFAVQFGEGSPSVAISVSNHETEKVAFEHFTIEEVDSIISMLLMAMGEAQKARQEWEDV